MPQYRRVPRMPRFSSLARQRRVAGAFQIPGGATGSKVMAINDRSEYTIQPPVETVIWKTGESDVSCYLPRANSEFYNGTMIRIKKADDSAGRIIVYDNPEGSDHIDGMEQRTIVGVNDSLSVMSDGWTWWIWQASNVETSSDISLYPMVEGEDFTMLYPYRFILANPDASDVTVTLPAAAPYINVIVHIVKKDGSGAGRVLVAAPAGSTLYGVGTLIYENTSVSIISDGTDWHIIADFNPPIM